MPRDTAGDGHQRPHLICSCPRVELIVNGAHALLEHVCVDLRGREIGVAQHHLDGSEVCTALEEMRRKRVAKHMWTEVTS